MSVSNKQLESFITDRSLVSIRRDNIDSNAIQAVPLLFSRDLLLVQYIYDFRLDGYLIFRRQDITSLDSNATDVFQKQLLLDAGLFQQIDRSFRVPLASFSDLLSSLSDPSIVILEREALDGSDFWIGQHIESTKRFIRLREFTGAGNWLEQPTRITLSKVTCCQLQTNYIQFYADYFTRRQTKSMAEQNAEPELPMTGF